MFKRYFFYRLNTSSSQFCEKDFFTICHFSTTLNWDMFRCSSVRCNNQVTLQTLICIQKSQLSELFVNGPPEVGENFNIICLPYLITDLAASRQNIAGKHHSVTLHKIKAVSV